jgi:DNA-binding NarL/FixJ family response regulator
VTRKSTILIVEDHADVARAIGALIADQDDMRVVGMAGTVAESVSLAGQLKPDVVLMDYRLPDGTGDRAGALIKSNEPSTRLIFVTRDESSGVRDAATSAGAFAVVSKSRVASDLLGAIRRAIA